MQQLNSKVGTRAGGGMISIMSRPGARTRGQGTDVKAGSSARVRMVGQDQCKVHMHAVDVKRTRASGQGLGGVKAGSSARTVKRKRSTSVAIGGRAKLCAQMERVCMRAPRPACAEHERGESARARERAREMCVYPHSLGTPTGWHSSPRPPPSPVQPPPRKRLSGRRVGTRYRLVTTKRTTGWVPGTDWSQKTKGDGTRYRLDTGKKQVQRGLY
jgi:hypothetical protein